MALATTQSLVSADPCGSFGPFFWGHCGRQRGEEVRGVPPSCIFFSDLDYHAVHRYSVLLSLHLYVYHSTVLPFLPAGIIRRAILIFPVAKRQQDSNPGGCSRGVENNEEDRKSPAPAVPISQPSCHSPSTEDSPSRSSGAEVEPWIDEMDACQVG